jgi:hypothetical protein
LNYFIIPCTIDTIEKNRRELKPATEEGASALRYAPPSSLVIGWRIKPDIFDNLRAIALHSRKGDRPEKLLFPVTG